MPRPTFALTDDQARQIVAGVAELDNLHPLNSSNHTRFLRPFIRLVFSVTGKTLSPAVYRRLLAAFAPGRTPSITTIAAEKARFVAELEEQSAVERRSVPWEERPTLGFHVDLDTIQAVVAQTIRQGVNGNDAYLQQQCAFLQQRLSASERELVDAKVTVGRLESELAALKHRAEQDVAEIDSQRRVTAALTQELARLGTVVEDARRFALLAIDESRAETRAWKERCYHAESQVKEHAAAAEVFRRLAYRQGAEIPALFNKPTEK